VACIYLWLVFFIKREYYNFARVLQRGYFYLQSYLKIIFYEIGVFLALSFIGYEFLLFSMK